MVSSTAMEGEVEAVAMEGEGEEMVESPQLDPHLLRHLAGLSGIRLHLQPPTKSTARLQFVLNPKFFNDKMVYKKKP